MIMNIIILSIPSSSLRCNSLLIFSHCSDLPPLPPVDHMVIVFYSSKRQKILLKDESKKKSRMVRGEGMSGELLWSSIQQTHPVWLYTITLLCQEPRGELLDTAERQPSHVEDGNTQAMYGINRAPYMKDESELSAWWSTYFQRCMGTGRRAYWMAAVCKRGWVKWHRSLSHS